ncbi:MAG: hypothetical protein ACK5Q2_06020 [Bacteroidota bacterium]
MKQLPFLILTMLSIGFTACTEDPCSSDVIFENNTNDTYNLYIDGEYKLKITNAKMEKFELPEGSHVARVEQVTGVFLFPRVETWNLEVGCDNPIVLEIR